MGSSSAPTIEQYKELFGPDAENLVLDAQRRRRTQRHHLPDKLKGPSLYLTDQVDGLITQPENSPFTSVILPYVHLDSPDGKISWQVYNYDEGLASRVPYESAARVLTQTKESYSAYITRQGLALTLEHNFMASEEGRKDFSRQLSQLIGSVQYSNDLACHICLLTAPSHERKEAEKYAFNDRDAYQQIRQYVDSFALVNKSPIGLDIAIEEAKMYFKKWGAPPPNFLLCSSRIAFQLNMTEPRTNALTQGPVGQERLNAGMELPSYRGIQIINTRSFAMETGAAPRDPFVRRVRVGEYYTVHVNKDLLQGALNTPVISLYDQNRDCDVPLTLAALLRAAATNAEHYDRLERASNITFVILRPCWEHEMHCAVLGNGGLQNLGASFYGQSEVSCYDDAQYGKWGMSFKYHCKPVITNPKGAMRLFDIAFSSYTGGGNTKLQNYYEDNADESTMHQQFENWKSKVQSLDEAFGMQTASLICMAFVDKKNTITPSMLDPVCLQGPSSLQGNTAGLHADPENIYSTFKPEMIEWQDKVKAADENQVGDDEYSNTNMLEKYTNLCPNWTLLHAFRQTAGHAANQCDSHCNAFFFEGSYKTFGNGVVTKTVRGNGHLGHSMQGCSAVRSGKGLQMPSVAPVQLTHLV
jgi:hypothetical protein